MIYYFIKSDNRLFQPEGRPSLSSNSINRPASNLNEKYFSTQESPALPEVIHKVILSANSDKEEFIVTLKQGDFFHLEKNGTISDSIKAGIVTVRGAGEMIIKLPFQEALTIETTPAVKLIFVDIPAEHLTLKTENNQIKSAPESSVSLKSLTIEAALTSQLHLEQVLVTDKLEALLRTGSRLWISVTEADLTIRTDNDAQICYHGVSPKE